jgi:hypothetical protein
MTEDTSRDSGSVSEPLVSWVTHPAKSRPTVAVLVTILIVVIAYGVYAWTGWPLFTALCTIVLAGSLSGFYFPTRYSLFEDRVDVKYTVTSLSKEWSQYRSFYKDKNGVLLSPFAARSRLENFRGVYLRFGDCDRDRVMAIIQSKIKGD